MTDLEALPADVCPDCGRTLDHTSYEQPALFRHGGYGGQCPHRRAALPDVRLAARRRTQRGQAMTARDDCPLVARLEARELQRADTKAIIAESTDYGRSSTR